MKANVDRLIEETKARMCTKKKAYESEGSAAFFADTNMQRPYKCPYCDKWHLTTKGVAKYRYAETEETC